MSRSRINPIPRESHRIPDMEEARDDAAQPESIVGGTAVEEQYRAVKESVGDDAPDVAVLEREAREAVDEELPWKRKFDPVFGYFKDRMGIDPHDVSFYYELSARGKDAEGQESVRRQQFTNFHDLREALAQADEGHVQSSVALKLPPEFLEKLHPGREFQKFADGFGIVRENLETDARNADDMYARAKESGELARLKEEDAKERGAGTERSDVAERLRAVHTELAVEQEVERVVQAAAEKPNAPEKQERELRTELSMWRRIYASGESGMREWEKKHKGFWSRRKLERAVKRASLGAILAPGDSELPTKAGAPMDALHDVANRENIFRDRLREQGITNEQDIRGIYRLEQHKVEYEHAKTALARQVRRQEVERLQSAGVSPEDALRQANATSFEEFVVKESLELNQLKLETWPVAEKGKIRQAWEDWRAWYGKLGHWKRAAVGVGVVAGIAGTGAAFGAIGAGTAAVYVGRRAVGAVAGAFGGVAGAKLVERYVAPKAQAELERLDARERALEEKMRGLEHVDAEVAVQMTRELDREYQSIMDARYGVAKRQAIAKAAGTVIGGFALGAGTSYAAAHLGNIDTLMPLGRPKTGHIPSGPKPVPEVVHEATPAPKPRIEATPEVRPTPEAAPERLRETPRIHAEQAPIGAQLEELATVKKGEGAWGPVRRQLRAQLTAHPEQFGLKPEDLQNGAKVQHALNSRTTQILKELGFIGPKGTTQMGIHPPGTKIFLAENGGLRIEGGHAYDYGAHGRTGGAVSAAEAAPPAQPETATVVHHEPVPAETLRPVPEPPEAPHIAEVPQDTSGRVVTKLSFLGDALQPAEGSAPTAVEVAAAAQETAALRAAIVQEATAHYADKYNALSPLGKECFVRAVERHVEVSNGRMLPAQVLRSPMMFEMDYELAQAVGNISLEEFSALEELGFTKEGLFTVDVRGDFGYASTLRDMRASDVVKNLTADGGGIDHEKLNKNVNFFLGGGRGSGIVIGERHLALAEKLQAYLEHGGKPDATVAEALVDAR